MKRLHLGLLLLLSIGCAHGGTVDIVCKQEPSVFRADDTFTAEERAAVESGVSFWPSVSTKIHLHAEYSDLSRVAVGGVPQRLIHRARSSDLFIQNLDAKLRDKQRFYVAYTNPDGDIWLVVDRLTLQDLPHVLAHEIGHSLRYSDPKCAPGEDCEHSSDPEALMCGYPRTENCSVITSRIVLRPSDIEMCGCLCETP